MAKDKLDPGGAPGVINKATRVVKDGFVEEDYPGYDPADHIPDLPGRPQQDHLKARRAFDAPQGASGRDEKKD